MSFYGQWGSWYEESEHPRGPGGKWTSKGGSQDVISKFKDYSDWYSQISAKRVNDGIKSLTKGEKTAIAKWTGPTGFDDIINPALRAGKPIPKEARDTEAAINKLTKRGRLNDSFVLERVYKRGEKLDEILKKIKVGQVISDKGYISTSLVDLRNLYMWSQSEVAKTGRIKILAPKGTKAFVAFPYAKVKSEREVILAKGTRLRYLGDKGRVKYFGVVQDEEVRRYAPEKFGPSTEEVSELQHQYNLHSGAAEVWDKRVKSGIHSKKNATKMRDAHTLIAQIVEDDMEAHRFPEGPYQQHVFKYVKNKSGQVIAAISYQLKDNVRIDDLASLEPGLGAKLLLDALDHGRRAGVSQAKLYALSGAIPFYEKVGFKRIRPGLNNMTMNLTAAEEPVKEEVIRRAAPAADDVGALASKSPEAKEQKEMTTRAALRNFKKWQADYQDKVRAIVKREGYKGKITFSDKTGAYRGQHWEENDGEYLPKTKEIILYPKNIVYRKPAQRIGIAAHEIQHAKFDAVVPAKFVEGRYVEGEYPKELHPYFVDPYLDPDNKNLDRLIATGKKVSPYAATFWNYMNMHTLSSKGITMVAIDETLAEVAQLREQGKTQHIPNIWNDLYDLIDRLYRKNH